jgi:uncharacterized protein (DUF427 family)
MALTLGSGPFGHHPGGVLNSRIEGPKHVLYFEGYPRRMRARLGDETVFDTTGGKLLYESSLPPVLYVPEGDVRQDLLEPTEHSTHCPFKGDASYWTVRAGDRVSENAFWGYPDPIESAPWLRGYVAAHPGAFDAWYEEDEEILGGLVRDPYHRVEVLSASVRVTVRAGGTVVAESARPKLVYETSHPVRAYLPLEDVRGDLLDPSEKTSICPYKGVATYWSVRAGGETYEDAVWTYSNVLPESGAAGGLVSFLGDGIEVEIERDAAVSRPRAAA